MLNRNTVCENERANIHIECYLTHTQSERARKRGKRGKTEREKKMGRNCDRERETECKKIRR